MQAHCRPQVEPAAQEAVRPRTVGRAVSVPVEQERREGSVPRERPRASLEPPLPTVVVAAVAPTRPTPPWSVRSPVVSAVVAPVVVAHPRHVSGCLVTALMAWAAAVVEGWRPAA